MTGPTRGLSINDGEELLLSPDGDEPLLSLSNGSRRRRKRGSSRRRQRGASLKEIHDDKQYQSLAYEDDESEVWRYFEAERWRRDRGKWFGVLRRRSLKRWVLVALTGTIIALLGVGSTYVVNSITMWKFKLVADMLTHHHAATAYFVYLFVNFALVTVAAACVVIEPVAAGSGIPEVKCFLNGINLPHVMRIKTLAAKLLGVVFSVSSGLPCGKEGPMIHAGACVGAGITQGKSDVVGYDVGFSLFQDFRNDREKRDFVACGAAAGVCTAFHAPIGGVLFALEEGATHWSDDLTWRTFFCTMVTLFVLYVGNTELLQRHFENGNMFSFGKFSSNSEEGTLNYHDWELVVFGVIGAVGGCLGATFNILNRALTRRRKKIFGFAGTVSSKARSYKKYIEVLVVSATMSTLTFLLPVMFSECRKLPPPTSNSSQNLKLIADLVRFQCPEGEFNEMASLAFATSDSAIRHLFHMVELGDGHHEETTFKPSVLFVFFVLYFSMAIVTYGLAVPSGLFVPSLLSGAAMGRLIGSLLHMIDGYQGSYADAGTYALVGAVAVLGGVARMTISLTVIMLEATGDMQYVLPLMITLMMSRWSGNVFSEGIYDMHIHLNRLPILENDPPETARTHDLCAREIMSKEIVTVRPVMEVGELFDTVSPNSHGCFPVVNNSGVLQGLVVRKRIAVIFQRKAFGIGPNQGCARPGASPYEEADDGVAPGEGCQPPRPMSISESYGAQIHDLATDESTELLSPLVTWDELEKPYPRYPAVSDFPPTDEERLMIVDLRPYINTSPYTVHESTSVIRAYRFFRLNALRQMAVVDSENRCIGVITRYDLLQDTLERTASAETNWEVDPDDLPGRQQSRRRGMARRRSDVFHTPRTRRIVAIRDGDEVVGYRFEGGGRPKRKPSELLPLTGARSDDSGAAAAAAAAAGPQTTAMGEIV